MFYLLKGSTHYTSLNSLSGMKGEYERLFRKIFTSKSKSIMYLHKLATFEEDQLLYLFKEKSKDKNIDVDIDLGLNNQLIEFRKNKLHFDEDSEKWLAALTLVSFEDKSGFDYIAKQLDIPDIKSNIYKGIISLEIESITSLFDELNREIPYDLQVLILNILKGDISAFRDLIIKRIQIGNDAQIHGYNTHRVFNLSIPNDLKLKSDDLNKYIRKFCLLISNKSLDSHETKFFIEKYV